jgi:hypothetical protein
MDSADPRNMPATAPDSPARKLVLSRREYRALADVAQACKGIQAMPAAKARAVLEAAVQKALEQFDTEAGFESVVGGRGKDLLCTAVESLNPLQSKAVRLWLIANRSTRDDLVYELDAILTGWRERLEALAASTSASENEPADDDNNEPQADQVPA